MNTRKLLDKFRGWAHYDPVMKQEMLDAAGEFFAFYEEPEAIERDVTLKGLFHEWFLFDRKTTRYLKTPAEIFLRYGGRAVAKKEKEFFKALTETVFGVFEVLSSDAQAGLIHIKRVDGAGEWTVKDIRGSQSMQAGNVLFARVIPLAEEPIFTGWVSGYPAGGGELKDIFKKFSDSSKNLSGLKPRYLLKLWSRPINWLEKGEFFCKTRLAGIWQRWCGKDRPFSELEAAVDTGDHDKYLLAQKTLLESVPDHDELHDLMDLLEAYWNLSSGKKAGLKTPVERVGPAGPGPVERKYLNMLGDANFKRYQKNGGELSKEENNSWLKNPANGENGLSPFELISKERKSNNHPFPEQISYSIKIQGLENKAAGPASEKTQAALGFMMHKNFKKAAQLYEEALTVLKHDKSVSFKIFGNLGICYALMGEREKAAEALREALRHNPDYDRAREHLSDIESMTDKQYKKFLKEGPDHLTHSEWRG